MGYSNDHARRWNAKYLGLINHVVFAVDASGSMRTLRSAVLNLLHEQIKLLATKSEETGQETRVSIYLFDDNVECVVYDRDVLRSLNLDDVYQNAGMTALMDATSTGINELQKTATLHGDHSFLFFVITDGDENASQFTNSTFLNRQITSLPKNWTMSCFVPDQDGVVQANKYGFPASNIVQWDVSVEGMKNVSAVLTRATNTYFTGRASGTRGYSGGGLFDTSAAAVNVATVQAAGLTPLDPKRYAMLPVRERMQTRPFVIAQDLAYISGTMYYQFMKTEHIQPQKKILVIRKATNEVYEGQEARHLIGLPDNVTIRGKPTWNDEFEVFVQSTAPNRNLIPGTTCIVLDPARLPRR